MWTLESAEQIEAAAAAGAFEETPTFDAKRGLPETAKKNDDLARDVAAMTTDGGVLLYGVGEDEHRRPTVPAPFPLAGVRERISQIVSTSISEVPYIDIHEHPLQDDPSTGFVVVVVPQSARAPHQVTAGGDLRFYGRDATGNRLLTEGDVARLYERRRGWDRDASELLQEAIEAAPFPPTKEYAFMHGFARPVVDDSALFERAEANVGDARALLDVLARAAASAPGTDAYSPSFGGPTRWRQQGADCWRLQTGHEVNYDDPSEAGYLAQIDIHADGGGHLFVGRAAERRHPNGAASDGGLIIFETIIASALASFLTAMGALYEAAGYVGQVVVGMAVTGLEGGTTSRSTSLYVGVEAYSADRYERTAGLAAAELTSGTTVARRLVQRLVDATTMRADYDPFEPA